MSRVVDAGGLGVVDCFLEGPGRAAEVAAAPVTCVLVRFIGDRRYKNIREVHEDEIRRRDTASGSDGCSPRREWKKTAAEAGQSGELVRQPGGTILSRKRGG